MKLAMAILIAAGLLTGCMGEREYMLRKRNAENQRAHDQVYDVAEITGPVTIGQGASMVLRASTQPFAPIDVPDGMAAQRAVIRDVVTGAVIGYGLHQAAGDTQTRTTNATTTTTTGGVQ